MPETRPYGPEDARRDAAIQMMKRAIRAAGVTTDYDADIEYMGAALVAFADEWRSAHA